MRQPISIVAVSPHQDDVALSITHTLLTIREAALVTSFTLVSCFTKSAYTAFPQRFVQRDLEEVRLAEDEEYLKRLGFSDSALTSLGLPDAPLRPEWRHGSNIHDPNLYMSFEGDELGTYALALGCQLAPSRRQNVVHFVPLGITHKDHVIASRACLQTLGHSAIVVYEDTPYNFDLSPSGLTTLVHAAASTIRQHLHAIWISDASRIDSWVKCVSAYESQFETTELSRIAETLKRRGGERIWMNERAQKVLRDLSIV